MVHSIHQYFPELNIEFIYECRQVIHDSALVLEMLKSACPTFFKSNMPYNMNKIFNQQSKSANKKQRPKKKNGFWNQGVLNRYGYYVQHSVKVQDLYNHFLNEPINNLKK